MTSSDLESESSIYILVMRGSEVVIMIAILQLSSSADREQVESLLANLRLDPVGIALNKGSLAEAAINVQEILADVAERGDNALVEVCRRFDDPSFTAEQIRVRPEEMKEAASRVSAELMSALRRSIAQVREYQAHVMPKDPPVLQRPGIQLGMRFTPLDSAGVYFPCRRRWPG
jgi:histidinol dehydrogenase